MKAFELTFHAPFPVNRQFSILVDAEDRDDAMSKIPFPADQYDSVTASEQGFHTNDFVKK